MNAILSYSVFMNRLRYWKYLYGNWKYRFENRIRFWKIVRLYRFITSFRLIRCEAIDRIPANSNPFHYDSWRMGSELVRGWMVMHDGFDRPEDPLQLKDVILINTRTGKRVKVILPQD